MTSGFVAGMYQSSLPPGYQVAERPPWPWPCGGRFIVRENKPRRDYGAFFAFLLLFSRPQIPPLPIVLLGCRSQTRAIV